MKKLIILTVAGLLLGLAGAVGIVVVREKQARAAALPAAADSAALHADSAGLAAPHDSAAVDSATAHLAQGDSASLEALGHPDSVGALAAAADSGRTAQAPVTRPDSLRAEVIAASGRPAGPDEQRLARIFAAMRPEEAARVLEQMTDPEIRLLLSHLRERQAAAIMSSIAPERAAVISSAVIRGERSSP